MRRSLLAALAVLWTVAAHGQESEPAAGQAEARAVNRSAAYYHFSMGRLLEESGSFFKAEAEYRKALRHDPRSSQLHTEVASAYLRNNRILEAIQQFETAARIDPDNLRARRRLGAIYYELLASERRGHRISAGDTLNKAIREYEAIGRLAPQDGDSLLVLGRLYGQAGRSREAIATLEKHLEVAPSSEEALSMLAELHRGLDELKKAVEYQERAVGINSGSPVLLRGLGLVYEQSGDFRKAAETYRKGMSVEAANVTLVTLLRRDLARALILDGQIVPAEKEYRKILEVDPDDGEAHLGLGRVSRTRHRYEEALEHLKKADASLQNNVEVIYELARLYNDLGRFEEAESGFERMLSLFGNPGDSFGAVRNRSISLTHLGLAAQELGKFEKAAGHFQELKRLGEAYAGHDRETLKVLGKENRHRARVLLIGLFRAARQVPRALDVCTAAKEQPPNRALSALCADVLAESGEPEEALRALEEMLKGDREDLEIYHYILQVYQREKRFEEAEKKLYEAEKYFEHEKSFYFMLGALQERQKEYDKAAATFRKVIALDPKHASALNYLGYMWADLGVNLKEALDLIKQAVALDPNNGAYLDSLGWVYFKMDRIEEAERYLVSALDRVRRDPTIHEHMGDLYYRKGKFRQARSSWQRSVAYGQDEEETRKVKKKVADLDTRLALSAEDE
jgi:tetratricopeptide (TPR) repeat protein